MAVKIRLKRNGRHKLASYRIVVADSRSPRDGRYIEQVGFFDPNMKENGLKLDEEKIINWLNSGAVPSDTVKSILSKNGIWKKFADSKKKGE